MSDENNTIIRREFKKLVHLRACRNWLSHSLGRALPEAPVEMSYDALSSVGHISFASTSAGVDRHDAAMLIFINIKAYVTYLSIREIVAYTNNRVQPRIIRALSYINNRVQRIKIRTPCTFVRAVSTKRRRRFHTPRYPARGTGHLALAVLIDEAHYIHDEDEEHIDKALCLNHSREEKDRVCQDYKNGMFSFTMTPEHTVPVYSNYITDRTFYRKPKCVWSRAHFN